MMMIGRRAKNYWKLLPQLEPGQTRQIKTSLFAWRYPVCAVCFFLCFVIQDFPIKQFSLLIACKMSWSDKNLFTHTRGDRSRQDTSRRLFVVQIGNIILAVAALPGATSEMETLICLSARYLRTSGDDDSRTRSRTNVWHKRGREITSN